ncbi:MAG TPA: hypothetical protein VK907_00045, partial [Phnomibacter sp.]|nr:hypothetical protein [Phnomibacter sp.]
MGGLFLLLVYKWSSTALLITGIFLTIGVPFITSIVSTIYEINLFGDFPDISEVHAAYISPSYLDNLRINHLSAMWRYNAFFLLMFAVPATGIFLFGIWMGRRNYLQHPEKHRMLLMRFIGWGLGLGFMLQILDLLLNAGLENGMIKGTPVLFMVRELFYGLA